MRPVAFRSNLAFLLPSLLSLTLLSGTLAGAPASPDSSCDPQLKQTGADPNGYHPRGDRCEGIYVRDVASSTLVVASLTESVEDFNPADGKPLLLEWTAPEGAAVRLRARSLRHRLYYQMDTVRAAGSDSYAWPTNLLAKLDLRRNELGLLAWAPQMVGGATRDIYLPLRLSQAAAPRPSSYQLLVLPGVELAEIFVSLARVESDGRLGPFLKKDEPLKLTFYPANRAVTVPLPPLAAPGLYYFEIKALRRAGGSASAPPLWFYHSGRPRAK